MVNKEELYERIIKELTGADEIRIRDTSRGDFLHGWVALTGADPDDVSLKGYDEGLSLSYDSEIYEDPILGDMDSRIIVEIWYREDVYEENRELREENERLKNELAKIDEWITPETEDCEEDD